VAVSRNWSAERVGGWPVAAAGRARDLPRLRSIRTVDAQARGESRGAPSPVSCDPASTSRGARRSPDAAGTALSASAFSSASVRTCVAYAAVC